MTRTPPPEPKRPRPRFKMRLDGADEDERLAQRRIREQRLAKLRRWSSILLLLSGTATALYVTFIALYLLDVSDRVLLLLIASFVPGSLCTWGAAFWLARLLHDRLWMITIGCVPLGLALISFGPSLPFIFPAGPCVLGLYLLIARRDQLGGAGDDGP
jgi:hypothetical protein